MTRQPYVKLIEIPLCESYNIDGHAKRFSLDILEQGLWPLAT